MIVIRTAQESDGDEAASLLRQSITELCILDHEQDPDRLQAWLANKTSAQVRSWVTTPSSASFVAVRDGRMAGFASIRTDGQILLNYVAPDARFAGISARLLTAMEDWARDRGLTSCTLKSTLTAARFYRSRGYVRDGSDLVLRKTL